MLLRESPLVERWQMNVDVIDGVVYLNEEIEHACMALEWLRRNMEGWDEKMSQYLFTQKDIVKIEED